MKKSKLIFIFICLVLFVNILIACKEEMPAEDDIQLTESAYLAEVARNSGELQTGVIPVCYTNLTSTSLFEVEKEYDFSQTPVEEVLATLLNDLLTVEASTDESISMCSIIPEGILDEVAVVTVVEENEFTGPVEAQALEFRMTKLYYDMSITQRIVMRAGLSRTIFSSGIVDQIRFMAPNLTDDTASMNLITTSYADDKLIINQYSQDFYTDEVRVHLYFGNADGSALARETKTLTMGMTDALPLAIMKALIAGPESEGLTSVIPQGTLVKDVFIKDNVCYVDLSAEFQKNHLGGEKGELLTIYSIVNSLQNVSGVRYVQFLIEGERVEYYKSYVELDGVLSGDFSLVQ